MTLSDSYHWRRQLLRGLLLMAFGLMLLLDRMDIVEARSLWHYSPLVLVVIGINRIIGYPSARDLAGGLWTAFIGLWLFASFEGLFGLSLWNSWPLFVIITGVVMALRPLAERRIQSNLEHEHETR